MFEGKHGERQIIDNYELCSYELSDVEVNSSKFRFPSGDLEKYFDYKVRYAKKGDVRPSPAPQSVASSINFDLTKSNKKIIASLNSNGKYYYAIQLTLQNVGDIAKIQDDCQQSIEAGELLKTHLFGRKFGGYVPWEPFNF